MKAVDTDIIGKGMCRPRITALMTAQLIEANDAAIRNHPIEVGRPGTARLYDSDEEGGLITQSQVTSLKLQVTRKKPGRCLVFFA